MHIATRGARLVSILIGCCATFWGVSNREAMGIVLPVAGVNPIGYSYYGTALPFVDVAHMSGRWLPVSTGSAAGASAQEIPLNATGYPSSLAPGQSARSLLFTNNGEIYPL